MQQSMTLVLPTSSTSPNLVRQEWPTPMTSARPTSPSNGSRSITMEEKTRIGNLFPGLWFCPGSPGTPCRGTSTVGPKLAEAVRRIDELSSQFPAWNDESLTTALLCRPQLRSISVKVLRSLVMMKSTTVKRLKSHLSNI